MGEPTSSDRFVRAFDRPFVITASLLSSAALLRWEFIKEHEKLRKQENTISTKKAIKKKRKKTRSQPRKRPRKKKKNSLFYLYFGRFLGVFSFFFSYFLVFFYKLSPLIIRYRQTN